MCSSKPEVETEKQPDQVECTEPPLETKPSGLWRQRFSLLLDLAYLVLLVGPVSIVTLFKYFFARRKPVENKVVLITGTGHGLGYGYALKFAELGCKVACVDIDPVSNQETVSIINKRYPGAATAYTCNIALPNDVRTLKEAVIKDFGEVNIVIHNAAVTLTKSLFDLNDDLYLNGALAVNFTSYYYMIREFVPDMVERNEGHFVALSSSALFKGCTNDSICAPTKHAVNALMESLYFELNENPANQVQTTTICPAIVNAGSASRKMFTQRFPVLGTDYTITSTVDAILKNRRLVTIPFHNSYAAHISKLGVNYVQDMFTKIVDIKAWILDEETEASLPTRRIVTETARQLGETLSQQSQQ